MGSVGRGRCPLPDRGYGSGSVLLIGFDIEEGKSQGKGGVVVFLLPPTRMVGTEGQVGLRARGPDQPSGGATGDIFWPALRSHVRLLYGENPYGGNFE